jgi:hypothetical protein
MALIGNMLSLLRLPGEIKQAIREEKIGPSQGYLCAENITYLSVLSTPLLPCLLDTFHHLCKITNGYQ